MDDFTDKSDDEFSEEEEEEEEEVEGVARVSESTRKGAREHMNQLQRLQEKDPEFYQFLKDNDTELLEFNDEGIDDVETDVDDEELEGSAGVGMECQPSNAEKEQKSKRKVITTEMVDSWCDSIRNDAKLSAVRSIMKAFRAACHYGDDSEDQSTEKFGVMSSSAFNKIMVFVLSEMDGILRGFLKMPTKGGKKETVLGITNTKQWKNYNHLVKSYLGNSLHILNQMTDIKMISFTLKCLKNSAVFLAAFPSLLRKYVKVALHFWGTGGGALPVVSFLFIRDLCVKLGSDCLDECFKGLYKAYVSNCQFVNATKLRHIQFLGDCVIELYKVDQQAAYQHAFVFIRQLAMILREALNTKTKEAFRKVYEWKFMNCLELWAGAVCAYSSEADFRPLAYPLTQIISGVSRLVPTARYFPLRLRCATMLNRIAASTGTFIPVSMLLLDMLEMKELNRLPTGGVGKAVDLRTILKVSKPTLKTRAFQEACVYSVAEELAEHLAQWSYSVAFFELAFIPGVRLRNFCKSTKIERFRREMRQLLRQIDANSEYVNAKRANISFLPNDPVAASFLEDEKESKKSPLSQYVLTLRQRAQQRSNSMAESSVLVGEHSSVFGNKVLDNDEEEDDDDDDDNRNVEEGTTVFSSSWLPGQNSSAKDPEDKTAKKKKRKKKKEQGTNKKEAIEDDVVEDLVLSSDEDGSMSDSPSVEEEAKKQASKSGKKRKPSRDLSKQRKSGRKKSKKKVSNQRGA
ncbi:hypothetical protein Scep_008212 [Stephania cephalantha]|uniref:Nucleolar complex protein 2 homolog n=1 Tax=Stephania cephalantha TaxID=152367 RepID=A0AAP0PPF6_9MAGN